MDIKNDIRWIKRFENFNRAYNLLSQVFDDSKIEDLSPLEQEGVIQRFEYTYELAWKTLKDYLEYGGINISETTARNVFKEAYSAGIIKNESIFVDMMLSRNLLSHTYDCPQEAGCAKLDMEVKSFACEKFRDIIVKVQNDYLPALQELYFFFAERKLENDK